MKTYQWKITKLSGLLKGFTFDVEMEISFPPKPGLRRPVNYLNSWIMIHDVREKL